LKYLQSTNLGQTSSSHKIHWTVH